MRKITFYIFMILCLLLAACVNDIEPIDGGSGGGGNGGNGGTDNGGGNEDPVIPPPSPPSVDYLCFTANEDGCSVSTKVEYSLTATPSLEYSTDKENWEPFVVNSGDPSTDTTVDLTNAGDKVYIRAADSNASFSERGGWISFVISGSVSASGNIMSLLDKDCDGDSVPEYAFRYLFIFNTTLTTAPALPATKLADHCYDSMFRDCSSLITAPELPATNLAEYCYYCMFQGCSSLTKAPKLPATILAEFCYEFMFADCSSLTIAPALPATTLARGCYGGMFQYCFALRTVPELPAATLAKSCYASMFQGCSSLTKAPELPATDLARECYFCMFRGCSSLTTAPDLPATTLVQGCYEQMFADCSKLSSITVCFTTWSDEYTLGWLEGVSASGTFTCPGELTGETGTSRIPAGWSIEHLSP